MKGSSSRPVPNDSLRNLPDRFIRLNYSSENPDRFPDAARILADSDL
jgi:hypothetical protein